MLTFLIVVTIVIVVIAILMAICGETAKFRARAMLIAICDLILVIVLLTLQFNSQ